MEIQLVYLRRCHSKESDENEYLEIYCFGWSLGPVENLLKTAKKYSHERDVNLVTIRWPRADDIIRRYNAIYSWEGEVTREAKTMDQFCLGQTSKGELLEDMGLFLTWRTKAQYTFVFCWGGISKTPTWFLIISRIYFRDCSGTVQVCNKHILE